MKTKRCSLSCLLFAAALPVMILLMACSLPHRDSMDGAALDRIAEGPADLRSFAADLEDAFNGGEWDRVLSFFDQENFRSQLEIGITTEQYMIEGLGLSRGDLPVTSDLSYPRLSSIVRVEIAGYDCNMADYYATLHGYAVTRDGRRLRIILPIIKRGSGGLAVSPPVG